MWPSSLCKLQTLCWSSTNLNLKFELKICWTWKEFRYIVWILLENFRRDYGNNRMNNRRNGRRGSQRRGRGNRSDYRGRGIWAQISSHLREFFWNPVFYDKGSSKNHVTGGRGRTLAGSRKKLVSRATLKGFMRGMHGHDGHRGRGVGSARFFADFPVTWFLDDPLLNLWASKPSQNATESRRNLILSLDSKKKQPHKGSSKNHVTGKSTKNLVRPALRAGGRGLFDFCAFVVF